MRRKLFVLLLAAVVGCRASDGDGVGSSSGPIAPDPKVALAPADSAPTPPPADAVVTLFGRHLTAAELDGEEFDGLTNAILGTLLDRYCKERDLVATDAEIASFRRFMASRKEENDKVFGEEDEEDEAPLSDEERAALEADEREIDAWFVVQWKTSKALHEQYGGTVIFQQFNPLEPVGAYLALLREHEAKGSFQIHDEAAAAHFWSYFTADHGPWVVDPERVDYSKPWWEQVEKHDRD